jgi:hypothetical protein
MKMDYLSRVDEENCIQSSRPLTGITRPDTAITRNRPDTSINQSNRYFTYNF